MSCLTVPIFAVLSIALLESFLSLDNAVVLAIIAKELPPDEQKRALRYGLLGAVVLRLLAVAVATKLIHYPWIKILGGLYLGYLAGAYFFGSKAKKKSVKPQKSFWKTVFWIEFTDLAFAIDSILAAVALTQNYWVVVCGGLIGVVVIRFAAQGMIKILEKYPKLETVAYVVIAGVAIKTLYEGSHSFW